MPLCSRTWPARLCLLCKPPGQTGASHCPWQAYLGRLAEGVLGGGNGHGAAAHLNLLEGHNDDGAEAPASATVWKTRLLASGRCWFTFQVRHMTSRCSLRNVPGASASQASLYRSVALLFRRPVHLPEAFASQDWLQEHLTQDLKVQGYNSTELKACVH